MMKGWNNVVVVCVAFFSVFLCKTLLAGQASSPSPVKNLHFTDSPGIKGGVPASGDARLTREGLISKTQSLQIPFIANNGQMDGQVLFYAKTFGGTVFVTKNGEIVYSLPHFSALPMPPNSNSNDTRDNPNPQSLIRGVALKERLVGGKIGETKGRTQSTTAVSYFKGNDPLKWKNNIKTYEVVDMGEVYKGIELKLKAHGNNVEKLFTVKPGASPEQIQIRLGGLQSVETPFTKANANNSLLKKETRWLSVNERGELVAETALGPVTFTKPVAYQEIEGKRVDVAVEYSIIKARNEGEVCSGDGATGGRETSETQNPELIYGFTVASYDKTNDLIIDPLLASTFLGGSGIDYGYLCAIDAGRNIYVVGETASTDFPTTDGAYDTSYSGGVSDIFVSKLNGELTSLLSSTFLGGSGWDYGYSLTLDTSGNVYLTGYTSSADFPTTSGAYATSYGGSYSDIFVSKLNSDLTGLLASTFLGGSGNDTGASLATDTDGNVYVTGKTSSTDFPITNKVYDTSFNGSIDVIVAKLNSSLTSLLLSTFLGGSKFDEGISITIDASGNVYVTGNTWSSDFPATSGTYDTSYNGAVDDVFISKLNSQLTSMLASTFLGGTNPDLCRSLTLDKSGNVYVAGNTKSSDFPTTSGAYDTSYTASMFGDAFISKLNGELTSLLASTYLGGEGGDEVAYIRLDASDQVYVTGGTSSPDFPTTSGACDTTFNGDADVFISKLDVGLTSLLASTFLGGTMLATSRFLALDSDGNVTVMGSTSSPDFPVTSGSYSTSFNLGTDVGADVFISKLDGNLSANAACAAKSITAAFNKLTLKRNVDTTIVVTVLGDGNCPAENVTVTATIKGKGKRFVTIAPDSRKTGTGGQTLFFITSNDKKGTALIKFKASGVNKVATLRVTVK